MKRLNNFICFRFRTKFQISLRTFIYLNLVFALEKLQSDFYC